MLADLCVRDGCVAGLCGVRASVIGLEENGARESLPGGDGPCPPAAKAHRQAYRRGRGAYGPQAPPRQDHTARRLRAHSLSRTFGAGRAAGDGECRGRDGDSAFQHDFTGKHGQVPRVCAGIPVFRHYRLQKMQVAMVYQAGSRTVAAGLGASAMVSDIFVFFEVITPGVAR